MLRPLLKAFTRAFGRRYEYDVSYLLELTENDPTAATKLMFAMPLFSHRGDLPPDVWHTAHIIGARAADCGPCLELAVRMSEEDGMSANLIDDILFGRPEDPDLALIADYAAAVTSNTPDVADYVIRIRTRFGQDGLGVLALAILAGEFYPLLKRGLGHATACSLYLQRRKAA